jgi:hypothetical protein
MVATAMAKIAVRKNPFVACSLRNEILAVRGEARCPCSALSRDLRMFASFSCTKMGW